MKFLLYNKIHLPCRCTIEMGTTIRELDFFGVAKQFVELDCRNLFAENSETLLKPINLNYFFHTPMTLTIFIATPLGKTLTLSCTTLSEVKSHIC